MNSTTRNNSKSNMIAILPTPNTTPLAPNPLLSSSLPTARRQRPSNPNTRRHRSINNNNNEKPALLSASIPLPKSHIHRTPSELQLADDMRRAEYEDVRMYARLVVGMQSQCMASGYVHPLTKKSLQDILKTKDAGEDELESSSTNHYHHHPLVEDGEEDGSCWGLSFPNEKDEQDDGNNDGQGSVDSPLPCQPMGMCSKAPTVVKTPSTGSIISTDSSDHQDNDDECVFSLEL